MIVNGDNLELLKILPDNSVDSVVTDAPYGLGKEPDPVEVLRDWLDHGYHEVKTKGGFMGKAWDSFVPQPLFWKEAYRVLKPGGHVASFFGTRTYDWGVMAMRLAGFEIRDRIQWAFDDSELKEGFVESLSHEQRLMLGAILKNGDNEVFWSYGSGFPKSHSVDKAIDKLKGAEREVVGRKEDPRYQYKRDVNGLYHGYGDDLEKAAQITAPATPEAQKWDGWGSALAPANEPIVLARKPLDGTIAENVLKWGTGGINVDGCRIGTEEDTSRPNGKTSRAFQSEEFTTAGGSTEGHPAGRFPKNFLTDGSPEVMRLFGKAGETKSGGGDKANKVPNDNYFSRRIGHSNNGSIGGDSGSASRYFQHFPFTEADRFMYCGKAQSGERDCGLEGYEEKSAAELTGRKEGSAGLIMEGGKANPYAGITGQVRRNIHPTVKPLKLMLWLCKLITPPGGLILDPFVGSGTTAIAAKLGGFQCLGMELEEDSAKIAADRERNWRKFGGKPKKKVAKKSDSPTLF